MKNFSWNYFCITGQIDAYLLYKDCEKANQVEDDSAIKERKALEQT
ncbi:YqzL family protein [Tepidibacillus decaturensis]|nr:YqzL family protein [Tepidibacillus decaturensis]